MSDFHEVLFPTDISYGSSGGPKWKTAVWTADSGYEARVSDWANVRAEYDVSMGIQSEAQANALTDFFMNRRGRAFAFRFKDWNDYKAEDVQIGLGDYANMSFQIKKTYVHGGVGGEDFSMTRNLKKVEWGSEIGVKIDGIAITKNPLDDRFYSVEYNTGILTYGEPPRGGLYAGTALVTPVNMITTAEGGNSTALRGSQLARQSTFPYDPVRGWGFLRGVFNIGNGEGLRKIDVTTGEEVLQRSAVSINADPDLIDYSAIVCVDPNGFVYLNTGGASNGQPLMKVDGANLNYVTHFGERNSDLTSTNTSHLSGRPGAASLDGSYLLHADLFGQVTLHSTETCFPIYRVMDVDNFNVLGICPYRQNGFAVGYHDPRDDEFGCALHIVLPNTAFKTFAWGSPTARVTSCHYDLATGGVIVFWEGEDGNVLLNTLDSWCGLWHENEGGWVWKRRMPEQHGLAGLRNMDSQAPLNGVLCWTKSAARFFGTRLWRLETATGLLQSRVVSVDAAWIAYDPGRNIILGAGGSSNTVIVSTDVGGVAMQPPEVLTVDELQYHVGVRFDTDHLNMKHDFWTYRSWESIPLVEVRNWDDLELD